MEPQISYSKKQSSNASAEHCATSVFLGFPALAKSLLQGASTIPRLFACRASPPPPSPLWTYIYGPANGRPWTGEAEQDLFWSAPGPG